METASRDADDKVLCHLLQPQIHEGGVLTIPHDAASPFVWLFRF